MGHASASGEEALVRLVPAANLRAACRNSSSESAWVRRSGRSSCGGASTGERVGDLSTGTEEGLTEGDSAGGLTRGEVAPMARRK